MHPRRARCVYVPARASLLHAPPRTRPPINLQVVAAKSAAVVSEVRAPSLGCSWHLNDGPQQCFQLTVMVPYHLWYKQGGTDSEIKFAQSVGLQVRVTQQQLLVVLLHCVSVMPMRHGALHDLKAIQGTPAATTSQS